MLNKESKEAFVFSVMQALPKAVEPDLTALWEETARKLEAGLPAQVLAVRDAFPTFFRRSYKVYFNAPRDYGVVKGGVVSSERRMLVFAAAVPVTDEARQAMNEAVEGVNAQRRARVDLELKLSAALAGVKTVEQLKKLYPELAEHMKVVERALPVVQDGSALIAELARAGLKFGEAA